MRNYHEVKQWHEHYERQNPASAEAAERGVDEAELSFNRNYVNKKLDNGLLRVWRVGSEVLCIYYLLANVLCVSVCVCVSV